MQINELEWQMVLQCARLNVDLGGVERIRHLSSQDVAWDKAILRAHKHCVLPLVARTLDRVASDIVPEAAMSRLRKAAHANATRNLRLTGELLRILELFSANGISCIPYKGPILAAQVYGDISLRQFGDLDIFVKRDDVQRVRDLLFRNGYRSGDKESTDKDINLRRDDIDVELEVHWKASADADPIQLPLPVLWTDLRPFQIAGKAVLTHRHEIQLLIQCVHGAKHGWERLAWVCDVAELVRSHKLDWNFILEQATRMRARRILFLGLALAQELLDAKSPAEVVAAMRQDPVLAPLLKQVKEWLDGSAILPGDREHFFIKLREHPLDKFQLAVRQLKVYLSLTPRDIQTLPVPNYLNWVLYIVRPFRLAGEYGLRHVLRFVKTVV
jgi:hypothetical protein